MGQNKYVLVVEDDKDISDSVREVLEDAGYKVETASNGLDAIAVLKSGRDLPALILLDLMMPLMDGYKFREEQIRDPKLSDLPVLIMTADNQAEAKNRIGVAGIIKKPLEIKTFLAEVRRLTG